MSNVINLTTALRHRVATLELEVAERWRILAETPRRGWLREACIADVIEAERRLSIAEGMRR
jgi:hypothetical protein